MTSPYIGTIQPFGFNFPPRNWAQCNGQLLAISQNAALFSLLGTTYGGNGTNNFALPDLRGRGIIHQGQGPGLQNYQMGQNGGTEATTLTSQNLPAHIHSGQVNVSSAKSTLQQAAANSVLGKGVDNTGTVQPLIYAPAGSAIDTSLAVGTVTTTPTGNNAPFSILGPYLTVNVCIALFGIFPSRN